MRTHKLLVVLSGVFIVFLASCKKRSYGDQGSEIDSLLDPHRLPSKGPWFEGWYVRITPATPGDRSFGAIVGSYLAPGEKRQDAERRGLKGYAAILDGGERDGSLRAFEAFPQNTRLYLNQDDVVERDPAPAGKASFRWAAESIGELNEAGVSLAMGNGVQFKAQWGGVVPWSPSGLGPEGIISLFRSFPLHWFVYSLASSVQYSATLPDPTAPGQFKQVTGNGFVHIEKNWGVSFPESYIWMQAHNLQDNRTVALAGGRPLKVAGVSPEAWLVGYRSEKFKQDFAPQNVGTIFESRVDGCNGRFELVASHLNRRLVVTAQAPAKTFGGIAIPKESGFEKDGSQQSFQTIISARLFEVPPLVPGRMGERLLEETIFSAGALEFGGSYKCTR